MLLWAVLATLSAAAMLTLLWPLTRAGRAEPARAEFDVGIYRNQLRELEREVSGGQLGRDEAAAARLEIERRLLAAARHRSALGTRDQPHPAGSRSPWVAVSLMLLVPGLSLALYLELGSPHQTDDPLVARGVERQLLAENGGIDLEKARRALTEKLATDPSSLEGWRLLARTDTELGRWADARADDAKALALSQRRSDILVDAGEVMMGEAQGTVTPEARALFEEALAKDPSLPTARYELAVARAQGGDLDGAIREWQSMLDTAPQGAPWTGTVDAAIAEAKREQSGDFPATAASDGTAPADAGPAPVDKPPAEVAGIMALPPEDRRTAIAAMVAGLAARLEEHPDDPAGWARLGRSYLVLGDPRKSADAYGRAAAEAPADPAAALGRAEALRQAAGDGKPLSAETVDAYRKVLALQPDQPDALWFAALGAKESGDALAARGLWQRLLGVLPAAAPEAIEVKKQLAALPPEPR